MISRKSRPTGKAQSGTGETHGPKPSIFMRAAFAPIDARRVAPALGRERVRPSGSYEPPRLSGRFAAISSQRLIDTDKERDNRCDAGGDETFRILQSRYDNINFFLVANRGNTLLRIMSTQ